MGFLRTLIQPRERKSTDIFALLDRSFLTAAGITVSEETALRMAAVWACVRVISEDVATLPLHIYERLNRGKRRASEYSLQRLLHDQPNEEMTALQFREALTAHVLTWGNAYAYIVRNRDGIDGEVQELWPLLPDRTYLKRDPKTRAPFYETWDPRSEQRWILRSDQVMHIAGLGFDGRTGYSPIRMHAQAIGLGLAAEEFGARFFGQGLHLGGFFEHPASLSDTAYTRLKTETAEKYAGLGRAHLTMILEEGMKFQKLGIPPDEAQFIEAREFQVTDIARIFRVPPHKIMDLKRATFSNIEHSAIAYVVDTLRPWLVRWEQAIACSLIPRGEAGRFFAEHKVEGLLRGDIQTRYAAYAQGRQWGWLSVNDIRELENLNPIEGGDQYIVPLNVRDAAGRQVEIGATEDRPG